MDLFYPHSGHIPPQDLIPKAQQFDVNTSLKESLKNVALGDSMINSPSPSYSVASSASSNDGCDPTEPPVAITGTNETSVENLELFRNMSSEYITQHRRAFIAAGMVKQYKKVLRNRRKSKQNRLAFLSIFGVAALFVLAKMIIVMIALVKTAFVNTSLSVNPIPTEMSCITILKNHVEAESTCPSIEQSTDSDSICYVD